MSDHTQAYTKTEEDLHYRMWREARATATAAEATAAALEARLADKTAFWTASLEENTVIHQELTKLREDRDLALKAHDLSVDGGGQGNKIDALVRLCAQERADKRSYQAALELALRELAELKSVPVWQPQT